MTWTLTATPEPTHDPPRTKLEGVESDPLISLQSVALFRDGLPLRFEAELLGQEAIAYDYDAPFDALASYTAEAHGFDVSPEFDDPFSAASSPPTGWVGSGWAAAAGVAASTAPGAVIHRDSSSAITSVEVTAPTNETLELTDSENNLIASVQITPDGWVTVTGSRGAQYVVGTGDYVVSLAERSVSVAGTGWSLKVQIEGVATRVRFIAPGAMSFVAKYAMPDPISQPVGLAFNAAGTAMFVADYNRAKVVKYVLSGSAWVFDSEFGAYGTGAGQMHSIYGIALDASDNIWVADFVNNKVLKFNSSGVFQAEYGTTGTGNGQFTGPVDIAFKSTGNFVVTDYSNNRVQEFDAAGAYVSKFTVAGGPNGVAIGAANDIIVTLWDANEVRRYNAAGVLQDTFDDIGLDRPAFVTRDSSGYVYVTDWNAARVVKFDSSGAYVGEFGTAGSADAQFWYIGGIKVRPDGTLYVADSQLGPYSTVKKLTQVGGSVSRIVVVGSGRTTLATASDTATLSPTGDYAGAWLVNAAQPELALRIDTESCSEEGDLYIELESRSTTESTQNSVALPIEGSAEYVTAIQGPRKRERWTLFVGCKTNAAKRSLDALLANSAAVNLRLMASQQDLGLDGGFYHVGTVTSRRDESPAVDPLTVLALPLTPTVAPAYSPLWEWNLDALAQSGMTLDDVNATFATLTDLLVGPV